jgi:hypothetical protein
MTTKQKTAIGGAVAAAIVGVSLLLQEPAATVYTASCWVMTTNQPVTLQFAYDVRGPWYNVTNVSTNTFVQWPVTNWNTFARTYITIP